MSIAQNPALFFHRLVDEVWNGGKPEIIDELFAPGCVIHSPSGDIIGPLGFRAFYDHMTTAFSNIDMKITHTISEGDLCVARFEFYADHTGPFMNIPPCRKRIRVTGNSMARFKNGLNVEGWDEFDLYGMLVQFGAAPPLGV